MQRHKPRSRRYRVSTRPKVRSRRRREVLAAACALGVVTAAILTLPRLWAEFPKWDQVAGRIYPHSLTVTGAPDLLEPELSGILRGHVGSPAAKAAAVKGRFPSVAVVRIRHDLFGRKVAFEVRMRRAVALVVAPEGRARGDACAFLGEDGTVFTAPRELYPDARLSLDLSRVAPAERRRLAQWVEFVGRPDALPSVLERIRFISPEQGWEAGLADGTTVLWGDLRWTAEKIFRLGQAVTDARRTITENLTADLRYFEDGKILVRPSGSSSL